MTFRERFCNILANKKVSQKEISNALNVNTSTVNNWAKKDIIPVADVAIELADFLQVPVEWLILGREKNEPPLFTPHEQELIANYRNLDDDDKRVVENLVDSLLQRYQNQILENFA